MFRIIREVSATVAMANQLAAQPGEGPRWSLFLTNRSFIAQVVALLFAVVGLFGLPLPIGAEEATQIIALIGYLAAQGWALFERLTGKTRTVWNRTQATEAAAEADALSRALRNAGAL